MYLPLSHKGQQETPVQTRTTLAISSEAQAYFNTRKGGHGWQEVITRPGGTEV